MPVDRIADDRPSPSRPQWTRELMGCVRLIGSSASQGEACAIPPPRGEGGAEGAGWG